MQSRVFYRLLSCPNLKTKIFSIVNLKNSQTVSLLRPCQPVRALSTRSNLEKLLKTQNEAKKLKIAEKKATKKKTSTAKEKSSSKVPKIKMDKIKMDRKKKEAPALSSIVKPVAIKFSSTVPKEEREVGIELAGELNRDEVLQAVANFARKNEVRELAAEKGLDLMLFQQVVRSFKKYCADTQNLDTELYILLKDITEGAVAPDSLFPYFLNHAKEVFPHLTCMEDLEKISDLRHPFNWYPEARALERKIIFHAGPTNSGKTYQALQRFYKAKTGLYCAPLKLLANEICQKSNDAGTQCDLITGDEKRFVVSADEPSSHVACTIEMASTEHRYDVAVIDEIQMLRDLQRGWAWTRALLGLNAKEIHVCGEDSAIELVKNLMLDTGDTVEVQRYDRLTPLTYLNTPVGNIQNIRKGDCIVCFRKKDIYSMSQNLERLGKQCAVIYGHLPPGTKMEQAKRFNDPDDPCEVMVATDAIGMGLNLCIKRIVFHALQKATLNKDGERIMATITPSQALQIAGRAGRKGTEYEEGEVTTYKAKDLQRLLTLKDEEVELIEQAGLFPTFEQIEMFAYQLPHASLSNLLSIFETICKLDNNKFFMCQQDTIKFLADMIEHIPLQLRMRYVFCLAPLNKKDPFVCTTLVKFARQASANEPATFNWLCKQIGWPFKPPNNLTELAHLEMVYDTLDLYLWLSYRFPELFPDIHQVRDLQQEMDQMIAKGVENITGLLQNTRRIDSDEEDELDTVQSTTEAIESTSEDVDDIDSADDTDSADDMDSADDTDSVDDTDTEEDIDAFDDDESDEVSSLGDDDDDDELEKESEEEDLADDNNNRFKYNPFSDDEEEISSFSDEEDRLRETKPRMTKSLATSRKKSKYDDDDDDDDDADLFGFLRESENSQKKRSKKGERKQDEYSEEEEYEKLPKPKKTKKGTHETEVYLDSLFLEIVEASNRQQNST